MFSKKKNPRQAYTYRGLSKVNEKNYFAAAAGAAGNAFLGICA
jgi:hypothetical protein